MQRGLVAALTTLLALAACGDPLFYGKLDEPSVAVTNTLPALPGFPAGEAEVTIPRVPFTVGDIAASPASKDSRVTLNRATLTLRNPTPGTTLAGIRVASVAVVPRASSALPQAPAVIASYDRATDGPADAALVLKGTGDVNLLPYVSGGVIEVDIMVGGTAPGPASWAADFTMDFHVVAEVALP